MTLARVLFLLALATCLMGQLAYGEPANPAPDPALTEPLARAMTNRVKLWQQPGTGAGLTARYRMHRRSSLLFEPLSTTGTLTFTAPATLELRDDDPTGVTTLVTGGAIQISANDPALPGGQALADGAPARRWLRDHLLALLAARDVEALRAEARLRPLYGYGYRNAFEVSPAPGHPARAAIHDLAVQLDPTTGEPIRLVLTETGGDVVTLTLSEHTRTPAPPAPPPSPP